jgi:hypothetical protein
MSQRSFSYFFAFLLLTSFLFAACGEPPREVSPGPAPTSAQSTPASSTGSSPSIAVGHGLDSPTASAPAASMAGSRSGSSGDIKWSMPARWKTGPEKPMRAATYLIPAAAGDSEGAECAVFVNIGGGVDANIKRWVGQFEQPDGSSSDAKAKTKKETINGFPVTTVDLTGIFTGGGMAMGQPSTKKPGFRLLGAIVEGPDGEVFFKLTGPAKTVAAAQAEFQTLLKSLKK